MFQIPITQNRIRLLLLSAVAAILLPTLLLFIATWVSLKPVPRLSTVTAETFKARLLDRHGNPLTVTYQNRWNHHDLVALHDMPPLLQQAFVISEDKRFFQHNGVDWQARVHAAWQNLLALDAVRGASTVSEQVVRMLHPRPRTLWSRWLEGFEAQRLEANHNKADILEFYLNQVPYAAQRRGVVQAANYYFNRDLATLTEKEMLALAVMVRAPAHFDVHKNPAVVEQHVHRLAKRLLQHASLDEVPDRLDRLVRQSLHGSHGREPVQARHLARYVYEQVSGNPAQIHTTLDSVLQSYAQNILDQRLDYLDDKNIDNAALLVVDHRHNEILAWVIGRSGSKNETAVAYDAVLTPRQPGSTLKPFVYALALSKGWTAATPIDDSPLSESVGHGLHTYHNYSRIHYGKVSLRDALGNSLNIPAVKAMQFVGSKTLLDTLHGLGIRSLDRHPDYYGDGLALGNGEVTLFELVQAYSTLARGGVFEPLHAVLHAPRKPAEQRVFSEAVATLIGHILSDPEARRLEFGDGGLLNLPLQTAVKTGTSSDYRDAWAVGYNHQYTVGVWMGNLRGQPMKEITGSTGPALVLRSLFAELSRNQPTRALPLSPLLVKHPVCIDSGHLSGAGCSRRDEWFVPGMLPHASKDETMHPIHIRQPHQGLQMALDPRIPDDAEAFRFQLNQQDGIDHVDWYLNGALIGSSKDSAYNWPLQRGRHVLMAKVHQPAGQWTQTEAVEFLVK